MKYLQRLVLEDPVSLHLYSFLKQLRSKTLLSGCCFFVLPSEETCGKTIENITSYPAGKYEIKIYYSGTKTICGMCLNLTVSIPA